jgi:hypothetical protein
MSLDGHLRDLGVPEVLQMLSSARKSGLLTLSAPADGRAVTVLLRDGFVLHAATGQREEPRDGAVDGSAPVDVAASRCALLDQTPSKRQATAIVLDTLGWRDGRFAFAPLGAGDALFTRAFASGPVSVDTLLIQGAQESEAWEELRPRIADGHVVPAFVDGDATQLPLLRLAPDQWELLTRVDGVCSVLELATTMGKPPLEIAQAVDRLVLAGVLAVHAVATRGRLLPTPPSSPAVSATSGHDLWDPHEATADAVDADDDSLWDPQAHDIFGAAPRAAATDYLASSKNTAVSDDRSPAEADLHPVEAAAVGVALLRSGDFAGAIARWRAARDGAPGAELATWLHDAIAAASELSALVRAAPMAAPTAVSDVSAAELPITLEGVDADR